MRTAVLRLRLSQTGRGSAPGWVAPRRLMVVRAFGNRTVRGTPSDFAGPTREELLAEGLVVPDVPATHAVRFEPVFKNVRSECNGAEYSGAECNGAIYDVHFVSFIYFTLFYRVAALPSV